MLRVSQEQTAKRPVDCAVTGVGRSVGSGNGSEKASPRKLLSNGQRDKAEGFGIREWFHFIF